MAGTITTSTIQNDTSSPPTFRNNSVEIGTLCRAWVNFNGTGTPAIRASFNVSSITDNGTGRFVINFSNALPDGNYSIGASASMNYGNALIFSPSINTQGGGVSERTPTTTSCEIYVAQSNTAAFDPLYVTVQIFR